MSGKRITYPKEGEKKLKETIQKLRAELRKVKKQKRILEEEIANIMKPVRTRKKHIDREKLTSEEWRKDFMKRFKENLKKRQEE